MAANGGRTGIAAGGGRRGRGARLGLLVASLAAAGPAAAGPPGDLGGWYIYFGQARLSPAWSLWGEAQYRSFDGLGDLEQLLLRTAVQRHFGGGLVVSAGYGFIRSEPYARLDPSRKLALDEHRVYQQLLVPQRLGRVRLTHRLRFEQRWVPGDFRTRGRYFLGAALPLNRERVEPGAIYLTAYDEIFLNTSGAARTWDRNRLYGGLGFAVAPGLSVQLGLMRQFVPDPGDDRTQVNLSVHHSLSF